MFAVTPEFAKVATPVVLPDPSKGLDVYNTSPVVLIVLALAQALAVLAFPVSGPTKALDVIDVNPNKVLAVVPKGIFVVPILILLLANLIFVTMLSGISPVAIALNVGRPFVPLGATKNLFAV